MRVIFCAVFLAAICFVGAAKASSDIYRMIAAAAHRHGIPASIALKVAKVESGFNCSARGKAGELGPLQIKPATARLIGYEGALDALGSCGAGLEWGIRHLAMAIRAGGVWKHNQGLWAKIKSPQAAAYEQRVMQVRIAGMDHVTHTLRPIRAAASPLRAGYLSPQQAASAAARRFP